MIAVRRGGGGVGGAGGAGGTRGRGGEGIGGGIGENFDNILLDSACNASQAPRRLDLEMGRIRI